MLNASQWWLLKGMGANGAERMKQEGPGMAWWWWRWAIKGREWWYESPLSSWMGGGGETGADDVIRSHWCFGSKWNPQIWANPSWKVTATLTAPMSSFESENVLQFYKHVTSLKLHNGSFRWALSYSILLRKNLSPKKWINSSSQLGSWKVKDVYCSVMSNSFVTPWTVAHLGSSSMEFSRQEYWSGLSSPSPGNLPNPGIEPGSLALQEDSLPSEPTGEAEEAAKSYWNPEPGSRFCALSHHCR